MDETETEPMTKEEKEIADDLGKIYKDMMFQVVAHMFQLAHQNKLPSISARVAILAENCLLNGFLAHRAQTRANYDAANDIAWKAGLELQKRYDEQRENLIDPVMGFIKRATEQKKKDK